MALDTHNAVRGLNAAGIPENQAEAIVNVVQDATSELVTQAGLEATLDAKLWKALAIQGGVIITGTAGLLAILDRV